MATNLPPKKGTETSAYEKALEIVAEIPEWDKRPEIRDAVHKLMMIDSMQPIADMIDDDDQEFPEDHEVKEYREQCGIFPWESQRKQTMLLQLLENARKRAPHETVSHKTPYEQALDIVARLPAGCEKLDLLYDTLHRLMILDANEPLAESSDRGRPNYDSNARKRFHDKFGIWPDERHAEQESLLKTISNAARRFEIRARQYGKKLPGDDQSDGNGESGSGGWRPGRPSLN